MEEHDYIVIGAGSSGCAVARGLSDAPDNRVLLLEAGPGADRFWINTPAGMAKLYFHKYLNWNFYTAPMEELGGRSMYWPRGKTLGGSSAINGMVFIRGHQKDFDSWRSLGNAGWGFEEVLPYFKQMEHYERGDDAFRGRSGPLWISDPAVKERSSYDFIEAASRTGLAETDDMNGALHDGVGFMQHNIRNGRRQSAYVAFIEPVKHRRNLKVQTETQVQRIIFEGRTAVGVEVLHKGRLRQIRAAKEVILSSGSLKSPQILMLSGVGPAAHLGDFGIEVVLDCPGVGQNLQDHFYVHTGYRSTPDSSYNASIAGLRKYWEGFRYLMTRGGYLALGSSQVAAFVKSDPSQEYADLQISFRPMTFSYFPNGKVEVERQPGMGVSVYQLRPSTTGHVRLRSRDALEAAEFKPNFLSSEHDVRTVISGLRKIREIMSTEPIASRVVSEEVPGLTIEGDDDLFRFMESSGNSAHHQGGTCKMGSDVMAVVDERLRVRGVDRLRVVDASIMPHLTSGNTNAPSMMIGVKAADMIRRDDRPRLSNGG